MPREESPLMPDYGMLPSGHDDAIATEDMTETSSLMERKAEAGGGEGNASSVTRHKGFAPYPVTKASPEESASLDYKSPRYTPSSHLQVPQITLTTPSNTTSSLPAPVTAKDSPSSPRDGDPRLLLFQGLFYLGVGIAVFLNGYLGVIIILIDLHFLLQGAGGRKLKQLSKDGYLDRIVAFMISCTFIIYGIEMLGQSDKASAIAAAAAACNNTMTA